MGRDEDCCGVHFVENILIVLNFVFLIAGCAVLGVAIWTIWYKFQYVSLLSSVNYPVIVYSLAGVGVLVIILAIIGFCSTHKEHRGLILCYVVAVSFMLLAEAVIGIVAFIYQENIENELQISLNNTFLTTYNQSQSQSEAIDYFQEKFRCCGAVNFRDWKHSTWLQSQNVPNKVPDSCCKSVQYECGRSAHPSNIYYAGCLERMVEHLEDHLLLISAVGGAVCLLQIFGIIFSSLLYTKLNSRNYELSEETNRFI